MNSVEELVNKLEVEELGKYDATGQFVINLENSDEFSSAYTEISELFGYAEEDGSMSTDEKTLLTFSNGVIEVLCEANYNSDEYQIVIRER